MIHKSTTFVCVLFLLLAAYIPATSQVKSRRRPPAKGQDSTSERLAKQTVIDFPQISLPAARLMVNYVFDLVKAGIEPAVARQRGMGAMAHGKALLPDQEQREMEDINDQILDSYSLTERERIERLRVVIQNGKQMTRQDQLFLQTMFKRGFESLPKESQIRLQQLNEKAIRAFIASQ